MDKKEKINTVFNIISFISFSIVVFGILALGFFVAPVIFKTVEPRSLAAELMTNIFERFYPFAFVFCMITIGSEMIRFATLKNHLVKSKLWFAQILIIGIVSLITAYANFSITPRIAEMQESQHGPTLWTNNEFVVLHKRAEQSAKVMFLLGLIPLSIMVSSKKKVNA